MDDQKCNCPTDLIKQITDKDDPLFIPFSAHPYPAASPKFIGRDHPFATSAENSDVNPPITESKALDLLKDDLARAEEKVRRCFTHNGGRQPALAVPRGPRNIYRDLCKQVPDAINMLVFLVFKMDPQYRDHLFELAASLDWHYLARIIRSPVSVRSKRAIELGQHIRALLSSPQRRFVCKTLRSLPMAGHRMLADEYSRITGRLTARYSSVNVQKRMLHHSASGSRGLSALCLSGGGIRSASFCLGAIQTLATHRLFGQFHFISTVSGGGYIGTGLMRWLLAKTFDKNDNTPAGLEDLQSELQRLRSKDYVAGRATGVAFEEEGPLSWLRMNSNYLSRRISLFSADAWTIVATYLRNLLIVWIMFWPWVAIFIFIPWFAVWLGGFPHEPCPCIPEALGFVGTIAGVVGASYLYQGSTQHQVSDQGSKQQRFSNYLTWPSEGDQRAAFGAALLFVASLLVSYLFWFNADHWSLAAHSTDCFLASLLGFLNRYWFLTLAIAGTQYVLTGSIAVGNTSRKILILLFAVSIAVALQILLLYGVEHSVVDWRHSHGMKLDGGKILELPSALRSVLTPTAVILALLVGESVKTALRSRAEAPDRREHQGRTHAFILMMLSEWVISGAVIILVPALLSSYGGSVPAATAAGSSVSLLISIYAGFRQNSPGKPDARSPMGFTLLGSLGMILLALIIAIGAWKVFEHFATAQPWQSPVRCECTGLSETRAPPIGFNVSLPVSGRSQSGFTVPPDERLCVLPQEHCVDRSFADYFAAQLAQFDNDAMRNTLGALALSAMVCFLLSWFIHMNEFSLHGFYRDRLIRAFYGGFRGITNPRAPQLFTGFDANDDVFLSRLKRFYRVSSPKFDHKFDMMKPPFLVVNTALNLVKGDALAWQERKADSFTFTALRAGNYRLGYRPVVYFAQGVKLGTAMAISGAAFNPNMGYNSSAPLAFLMSVFNVRLGWWLGNPRAETWKHKDPNWSSYQLLKEAAGQTADDGNWIHLSDGGHFDNLGLWEMIHRRCRFILVIDASADKSFSMEDFYSAIRKIRIDMGIEIEPEDEPVLLFPRSMRASGRCFARFRIRYSRMEGHRGPPELDGQILYLKPCLYGLEPPDVLEYAEKHPDFPHEPTADQFFGESQFESYRKLGEWEMDCLLRDVLNIPPRDDIPANVPLSPRDTRRRNKSKKDSLFS
ncbi:hypothetical protein [Paraburkholderia sp. BL25I1N1]|uniref:hypothetical protein n=1 Tax=Paraburkholderia sp. BL25I1N1 TaxID=1938804 RepID=UPI000D41CFC2|nr:hypothetical protein [Paraburkholderia sp. BL25I1N1]PRY03402.1 patatin-like phospholipase [Paraburkholderia sp. BL25I1N1]